MRQRVQQTPYTRRHNLQAQKAIFLDNGIIVPNIPTNTDFENLEFLPTARDGLVRLAKLGFIFVVITNQPGVALGYIQEDDVQVMHQKMESLFRENDLKLGGFYYCPHTNKAIFDDIFTCSCRKPQPFLFRKAAYDLQIDLSRSWIISDALDDIEAGHRAGCRAILINNGTETQWRMSIIRLPDYIVPDFEKTARLIDIFENTGIDQETLR